METKSQTFVQIDELKNIYLVNLNNTNKINILNSSTMESSITRLLQKADKSIFIDLKNIQFIDSTGFKILTKLNIIAIINNVKMVFYNLNKDVFELIDLLGLFNEFAILDRFPNLRIAS